MDARPARAFAERIEAILLRHIPDLHDNSLARRAISPADLRGYNANLVGGGDPYGVACTLDQLFAFRPFAESKWHKTWIKGLYHIGASAHPGPGLSGGSGFLVARELGA